MLENKLNMIGSKIREKATALIIGSAIALGSLALSSCASFDQYRVGIYNGTPVCLEKYCTSSKEKCTKGECSDVCTSYSYRTVDEDYCNRW
jgi:hypothetical protein